MFVVTVTFKLHAAHETAFLERMRQQAAESMAKEDGCRHFDVCTASDGSNKVFLYEIYSDQAAFDVHVQSDHFKDFDAAVRDWVAEKSVQTWNLAYP